MFCVNVGDVQLLLLGLGCRNGSVDGNELTFVCVDGSVVGGKGVS